jgi:hypothetical protein
VQFTNFYFKLLLLSSDCLESFTQVRISLFCSWLRCYYLLFSLIILIFQKQNRFVSKEIDNMACAAAPNQSINVYRHFEYISSNHNQLLLAKFNEMRQHKHRIDVTLIVGRRRIPAHRTVLEAASDYFRSMFRSAMNECQQSLCCTNFGLIFLNNYRSNRNVGH